LLMTDVVVVYIFLIHILALTSFTHGTTMHVRKLDFTYWS
jgi:hypothetical protein